MESIVVITPKIPTEKEELVDNGSSLLSWRLLVEALGLKLIRLAVVLESHQVQFVCFEFLNHL